MGHESHKLWDFNKSDSDFDSSSNDSNSSPNSEYLPKKHKLVSSLNSHESRSTPAQSKGQMKVTKSIKGRRGNVKRSKMEWGYRTKVDRKRDKTSVFEVAAQSDDIKIFMESLLEEVKVARKDLLEQLKEEINKTIEGDTSPQQTQEKNSYEENTLLPNQKDFEENVQGQHQNIYEESVGEQHENKFEDNGESLESRAAVDARNYNAVLEDQLDFGTLFGPMTSIQNNKGESLALSVNPNAEVNPFNKNVQRQDRKTYNFGVEAQNYYGGSTYNAAECDKTADINTSCQVPGDLVDYSRPTNVESLSFPIEHKFTTNPSRQSVLVEHLNNVDASMTSQNCNAGSLKWSTKGKEPASLNHYYTGMENRVDYGQSIFPTRSTATDNRQKLGSSMHLTLPTVLPETRLENRVNTYSNNCIQPTLDLGSKTTNLMLNANVHRGYFPHSQQEERIRSYPQPQTGSRNISCFSQNRIPTTSIGTGFPVQFQQNAGGGLGIPYQVNNSVSGLRMNGGDIRFSGVNRASSGNYAANNYSSQFIHKADPEPTAFHNSGFQEGHHMLQKYLNRHER